MLEILNACMGFTVAILTPQVFKTQFKQFEPKIKEDMQSTLLLMGAIYYGAYIFLSN